MTTPAAPAPSEPGSGPALRIAPARQVAAPISFETARGDDASARAGAVRRGAADIRLEVFVVEQGVPLVLEIDAKDDEATTVHVLARGADGTPLATGRLLLDPEDPGHVHLGRLAVRLIARGTGLGARMVAAIERIAIEQAAGARAAGGQGRSGDLTVVLSAQERAMGFYERCGYRPVTGQSYMDAGIPHQDMARTLSREAR